MLADSLTSNATLQISHDISQLSSLGFSDSQQHSMPCSPLKEQDVNTSTALPHPAQIEQKYSYCKREDSQSNLLEQQSIKHKKNLCQLDHSQNANMADCTFCASGKDNAHISTSSREIVLQAELIELQIQCTTLVGIIHKLSKIYNIPLSDLHNTQADSSISESSISIDDKKQLSVRQSEMKESTTYLEDMQNFQSLQKIVQNFKSQLRQYQEKVNKIHNGAQLKMNQLNGQIQVLQHQLNQKNSQIQSLKKSNQEMVAKNEELLLQLQKINEQMTLTSSPCYVYGDNNKCGKSHYQSPISAAYANSFNLEEESDLFGSTKIAQIYEIPSKISSNEQSFTVAEYQECIGQMQKIIQKLAKTLQLERKSKNKLIQQIDRLFQCVKNSESEIQKKNNFIFQLEKQILFHQATNLKKQKYSQEKSLKKEEQIEYGNMGRAGERQSQKDKQVHRNSNLTNVRSAGFLPNHAQSSKSGERRDSRFQKRQRMSEKPEKNVYVLNRPRPSYQSTQNQYYV